MDWVDIAIVGMGPRGLTILERILENAHLVPADRKLRITVFDRGECGQGVHRSHQPAHLLTNTLASQVTMYPPQSLAGGSGTSFFQWARMAGYRRVNGQCLKAPSEIGEPLSDQDHLPRHLLGEYLSWVYAGLVERLPSSISVSQRRETVVDLAIQNDHVDVMIESGTVYRAQYVYLATGHGARKPTAQDLLLSDFATKNAKRNAQLAYVASPYPVEKLDGIANSAVVAIQGFGLTAQDVISSLTVGRGGHFKSSGGKLRYVPSGREPKLLLFSRTCLPFAARGVNQKGLTGSHRARFFTPESVEAIRKCRRSATGDGRIDFRTDMLPLIIKEMAYAYRSAETQNEPSTADFEPTEGEENAIRRILQPLEVESFASFESFRLFFETCLRDDYREACRGNTTSPTKAATDVLRDTRAAIRSAVEYGGLTPESHRYFVEEFNATTNRISFGPPKQRSLEYLALREAGLVDLAGGPNARLSFDNSESRFRIEGTYPDGVVSSSADVVVMARLDSYSPLTDASRLSANLLKRGLIRPYLNGDYHPGGIDIDASLRPIGADGMPARKIWVLGYPVEGPHFYTHALPRPGLHSRQTHDAETCVRQMLRSLAALSAVDHPDSLLGKPRTASRAIHANLRPENRQAVFANHPCGNGG